jgi:hypothetical protein
LSIGYRRDHYARFSTLTTGYAKRFLERPTLFVSVEDSDSGSHVVSKARIDDEKSFGGPILLAAKGRMLRAISSLLAKAHRGDFGKRFAFRRGDRDRLFGILYFGRGDNTHNNYCAR